MIVMVVTKRNVKDQINVVANHGTFLGIGVSACLSGSARFPNSLFSAKKLRLI